MQQSALDTGAVQALADGVHPDAFSVLGPHRAGGERVVRTVQPYARDVYVLDRHDAEIGQLQRRHAAGVFEGSLPARVRRYRYRIVPHHGDEWVVEDPYRFPSTLGDIDRHLLSEGAHGEIYRKLGSHVMRLGGVDGTHFAVWAPNASRVSVVGNFNGWDGRCHPMRGHPGIGVWDIFIPGVGHGDGYKYELLDQRGRMLALKSDPYAHYCEAPPGNASIVYRSQYRWRDGDWLRSARGAPGLNRPISIYEVHLGSWRRRDDGEVLSYRALAEELVEYTAEMGYTHIELLPVSEYPYDGSWGYQPIGMYAPTHRHGQPDDFRAFVDCCHQAGIGVIVDWVAAHFPKDVHGLARFDGTALYEHDDPRRGEHADWGTLIFNYGRSEVLNYLVGCARYWIEEFHIDGLRVDAVASMLYLDYSREEGQWLANEHGGRENLEAVEFLRRLNEAVHELGAESFAEESTAWPAVSRPTYDGGLGFTYKWNMGWMHDTLAYMSEEPIHRQFHHDKMTFGLVYAFNENFVLPLSHDEVVHGKRSILGRMPGDRWQRFANLRAYYGFQFAQPGKKLLFMGNEFGQVGEWNFAQSLDWHLLEEAEHAGVRLLVRDLNRLYASTPALHAIDFEGAGFQWVDWETRELSVFAWLRYDGRGGHALAVSNFTPVVRQDYRLGVPQVRSYRERINTDDAMYGGSGQGNPGLVESVPGEWQGQPASLRLTLPPLSTLILTPASSG